jgi:hypothetical protein
MFGLLIVFIFDYNSVMEKGFFHGYTTVVWLVIILQVIERSMNDFDKLFNYLFLGSWWFNNSCCD